jgi:hypothetical protein
MAKLTTPIPQDKIGESFVWRDWFQRLSDKVFGTLATQDAHNVAITGGSVSGINFNGIAITNSTVDNTRIGSDVPSTGSFTSIILGAPLETSYGGTGVNSAHINYVFAGPASGSTGAPTFRALVANDIPPLPYTSVSTVLTKTADYTIANGDTWIINNKSGSALTLTFPAASSWVGRSITVKNMQPQLVNSASSNIVPIDSTTAGTAILLAVVGNWATMVSDGTNWVIMQSAPNNILLLE